MIPKLEIYLNLELRFIFGGDTLHLWNLLGLFWWVSIDSYVYTIVKNIEKLYRNLKIWIYFHLQLWFLFGDDTLHQAYKDGGLSAPGKTTSEKIRNVEETFVIFSFCSLVWSCREYWRGRPFRSSKATQFICSGGGIGFRPTILYTQRNIYF